MAAHGPRQEGCCLKSEFGCCSDHITPAQGQCQMEGSKKKIVQLKFCVTIIITSNCITETDRPRQVKEYLLKATLSLSIFLQAVAEKVVVVTRTSLVAVQRKVRTSLFRSSSPLRPPGGAAKKGVDAS